MKVFHSRFGGLYLWGVLCLAGSFLLRLALWWQWGRSLGVGAADLAKAVVVGLLFDVVTLLCLAAPATLVLTVLPQRAFRWRVSRYLAVGFYFLAVFALLLELASEWLFWEEFGVRFNFVAVDYLVYTQEVLENIHESYPVVPIITGLAAVSALGVFLTRKVFRAALDSDDGLRRRLATGVLLLLLPVLSLSFLSPALAHISSNPTANELAGNGIYSLAEAMQSNVLDYEQFYITQNPDQAFARLRGLLRTADARYVSDDPLDITREVKAAKDEERYNVLIVVAESLSADYLGAFGNREELTPNLDALAGQSLLFRRCYATGTRTDRGLEAITLSVPPTPGRSVLKRSESGSLFSIGHIFRQRGYDTKFIYGGSNRFDDMGSFFARDGFQSVERADFADDEITFANAWGVCDGDLYRKTLKECDRSFADGRPLLSVVLTTSNHRPFTYPPVIDIASGSGRRGAVKYADFALGEFVAQMRTRPWFKDTLLVVIADHCSGAAGKTEVPVDRYHIPLLIYAPERITPRVVDKLTSQIDLAPTLLRLLQFSYQSRFFGRDVLAEGPGRAPLGIYQKVGLLTDDQLVVLLPKKKSLAFRVDPNGSQETISAAPELLDDAVAYYQCAAHLLKNHLYTPIPRP
jgi:phosphoglycerol transferase MdoB-like AlkP superfamily enzyme